MAKLTATKMLTPDVCEATYVVLVPPDQVARASAGRAVIGTRVITPEATEISYLELHHRQATEKRLKLHEHEKAECKEAIDAMALLPERNVIRRQAERFYTSHAQRVDDLTEIMEQAKWTIEDSNSPKP